MAKKLAAAVDRWATENAEPGPWAHWLATKLRYKAEYERTRFANDIAIRVLGYRTEHSLTQTAFGRLVGMRQPHIARLESGEHEPSLSTLVRLAGALGEDLIVAIKSNGVRLRQSA